MSIKITHIETANPKMKLSQSETLDMLRRERSLSRQEESLYKRFLSDRGIRTRYFAVEKNRDFFVDEQDSLISRFQEEAARLSVASVKKCISRSLVKEQDIDFLSLSTCTGYLCPGLTSYVIEKTGMREDIFAMDAVGMGCGGALPVLRLGHNFLSANGESYALAVSTEICSSAVSWGEDPELVLSNSIFSDGSAACILTNKRDISGLRFIDFESRVVPKYRDELRFTISDSKLRNVIKPSVPKIAANLLNEISRSLLDRNGLKKEQVTFWALHPGGTKVLDAIKETVGLTEDDLQFSRDILKRFGNMSSPTVLYVLKDIYESKKPKRGDIILAASFGAGFSGYAVLLMFE